MAGGSSGGSAASVAAGSRLRRRRHRYRRLHPPACCLLRSRRTQADLWPRERPRCHSVVVVLDHVGPLTNSVYDAALMLQVLSRASTPGIRPALDCRSRFRPLSDRVPGRICASEFREHFSSTISIPKSPRPSERQSSVSANSTLRFARSNSTSPADRTFVSFEAYAYHEPFVDPSPELYQPATLARIRSGANISADDALRASRELEARRHAIRAIFDEVDMLLTPTVPIPPPTIGDLKAHPDELRPAELIMLRNTRPFNVWGIPAISVPCGFTKDGLPIGLQLAAAPWREDVVLQVAHAYEQATEWHKKMPAPTKSHVGTDASVRPAEQSAAGFGMTRWALHLAIPTLGTTMYFLHVRPNAGQCRLAGMTRPAPS